jgi:hypothetical protein
MPSPGNTAERPTPESCGLPVSDGISWLELMAADSRPPDVLVTPSYQNRGSTPISAARYTSEHFARLERERMWPRVWQFAAREEDLPDPGDYVVYENAGRSFLISRQDDGSVRAMHNVPASRAQAAHRRWQRRPSSARSTALPGTRTAASTTCPASGISSTWTKPSCRCRRSRWAAGAATSSCARSRAGREEFLAPLPDHFKRWRHEECVTVMWVGKVPANWKVTAEAFMEAWHTVVTHPQLLPFTGDCNSAYWTWGDHVNVNLVPFGTMSPHLDPTGKSEQWIVDQFVKYNGRSGDNYDAAADPYAVSVPEGMTAREALGARMRAAYTAQTGYDHEDATDAELLDALVYNVFPNFAPWGGFMPNIVYRWRPGKTPDTCIMEVRILMRVKKGEKHPRGVPMKFLRLDQKWTEAPELGILGDVFEQDMDNLPYVQEGLHASKTGKVQLGNYQEIRIRQFQQTLDRYLGIAEGSDGADA